MPKPNQYKSLHTSVIGPEGERVEVQIRTHEMHAICEGGVAAHWDYKEAGKLTERNKQQFAWLRQLMEWQQDVKDPDEFLDIVKYDLFTDEVFVFTPRERSSHFVGGDTGRFRVFDSYRCRAALRWCQSKWSNGSTSLRTQEW